MIGKIDSGGICGTATYGWKAPADRCCSECPIKKLRRARRRMEINSSRIQELVDRPTEGLSIELKTWIDPESPEGMSKIVRAVLALRNHGGGYLVIGFDDKTRQPDRNNVLPDVKSSFHVDKIQELVSRFSSAPFEVAVEFPEREGQIHPVVVVPPGVKTPVAAKAEIPRDDKKLVSIGDVYVRSLLSNNTASTTKAGWKDWQALVEVCFDNREADIGRFLRRHLGGLDREAIRELIAGLSVGEEQTVRFEDKLRECLQEGFDRFRTEFGRRDIQIRDHGSWEVALVILGDVPEHSANRDFLNLLDSSNPEYTGWPVWLDSSGFSDQSDKPYVFNGVWEALIASVGSHWNDHLDFMRMDPKGRFYLRSALQDDVLDNPKSPAPMTVLDVGLPVIRSAESIAVGLAFAKAMGCNEEDTRLAFGFRWSRLRGRELISWATSAPNISAAQKAYQDVVEATVVVPLDAPLSVLGDYVNKVVQPLYGIFGGVTLRKDIVDNLVRRLVERQM